MTRRLPNILITGTPGTGKSTHSQALLAALNAENDGVYSHIDIGAFVKQHQLYETYDEEWSSYIVDEDKLMDALDGGANGDTSPTVPTSGGYILDWHTCDAFPESWIDLVVVLRTDHTELWRRLEKRGYALNKIQENNEAEIMQVVLEDAKSSYPDEIVVELQSHSVDDVDSNVDRIVAWSKSWLERRNA